MLSLKRLALPVSVVLACAAPALSEAPRGGSREIEIQHLDGTGTKTIIDVHPSIPGVRDLIRSTPAPAPNPGEIIIAPTAIETPTAPAWTPRGF